MNKDVLDLSLTTELRKYLNTLFQWYLSTIINYFGQANYQSKQVTNEINIIKNFQKQVNDGRFKYFKLKNLKDTIVLRDALNSYKQFNQNSNNTSIKTNCQIFNGLNQIVIQAYNVAKEK